MRNFIWILVLALLFIPGFAAGPAQLDKSKESPQERAGRIAEYEKDRPTWAFPVADKVLPPRDEDSGAVRQLPGSAKSYTQAQIDDGFNPPDWFPDEHAPMPSVVQHGSGTAVPACAVCHLASGLGHPESANLTGLSVEYSMRQIADFRSGARKDSPAARFMMSVFTKSLSEDDARQASEWFATLKPSVWEKVVETDTVPKTFVNGGRMRSALPGGNTEPIGNRIIVVPQDPLRAISRDPHSGFIAYVPVGSIARGEELVKTGGSGKTIPCSTCHGQSLTGLGPAPRIAGSDAIYIVRQLHDFQTGARASVMGELMKAVVAQLNLDDMVAIAAYVASRAPVAEKAN
jgi:cytochrome c553